MDTPRTDIEALARRLDIRRLDSLDAAEAARDLKAAAWRHYIIHPVRDALAALWRGFTAYSDDTRRPHRDRIAP